MWLVQASTLQVTLKRTTNEVAKRGILIAGVKWINTAYPDYDYETYCRKGLIRVKYHGGDKMSESTKTNFQLEISPEVLNSLPIDQNVVIHFPYINLPYFTATVADGYALVSTHNAGTQFVADAFSFVGNQSRKTSE